MVKTGGNAMKKIISFFAMAAMLLVSCTNELDDNNSVAGGNPSEEGIFAPGKYTFNVTVADTKAVKTAWENGDKIFVFFDDAATKAATDVENLPYITLIFNGEEWVANDENAPAEIPASGTLSAVFCPFGAGEITKESSTFYISKTSAYFMQDTEVPYVNENNVVAFGLDMAMEVDFAQIWIPAEGLDETHEYSLSVKNTEKIANNNYAAGLKKSYTAVITPYNGKIICQENNCGAPITGHYYDGGFVFYGIASLGEDAKLAFELKDITATGNDQNIYVYTKKDIQKFEGRMAIKLPAISEWTDASYSVAHKRCRLYEDGTLVINENRFEHADIALKHGNIVATYPQQNNLDYSNTGASQPWIADVANITAVEFGTALAPTSMRGAFCNMAAVETIKTANLDLSNCTTMQCAFKNCKELSNIDVSKFNTAKVTNMESLFYGEDKDTDGDGTKETSFALKKLTALDVSSWDVSKVQDFRYMFRQCENLEAIDCSNWQPTAAKRFTDTFRGCFKITELDLSNFDTSNVTDMDNMFYQCYALAAIYAYEDFSSSSLQEDSSGNLKGQRMFHQCNALIGGNGTVISGNPIDYTYARIDTESTPGYFTLKQ